MQINIDSQQNLSFFFFCQLSFSKREMCELLSKILGRSCHNMSRESEPLNQLVTHQQFLYPYSKQLYLLLFRPEYNPQKSLQSKTPKRKKKKKRIQELHSNQILSYACVFPYTANVSNYVTEHLRMLLNILCYMIHIT